MVLNCRIEEDRLLFWQEVLFIFRPLFSVKYFHKYEQGIYTEY